MRVYLLPSLGFLCAQCPLTCAFVPQVDPKLVMEQAERESSRGKSPFLYQLHRLIVLSS